jgi:hypothetical protein
VGGGSFGFGSDCMDKGYANLLFERCGIRQEFLEDPDGSLID